MSERKPIVPVESKYIVEVEGGSVPLRRVIHDEDGSVMFMGYYLAGGTVDDGVLVKASAGPYGLEVSFGDKSYENDARYVVNLRDFIRAAWDAHKQKLPNKEG